jgi:2,5-diamino-6-(ribosylamino)-4(3H)-pyrimidinone 5'-phosphate reductase
VVKTASTRVERTAERLLELLDKLATESAKGTPIIVEGQNDVKALRKLKVEGDIIPAKTSGKSFLDVVGEVEKRGKREVIVLMDFDRRGVEWTKRLTRHLERMETKPNLLFWRELRNLVGRDVKDIEGLASYMETLKERCKI